MKRTKKGEGGGRTRDKVRNGRASTQKNIYLSAAADHGIPLSTGGGVGQDSHKLLRAHIVEDRPPAHAPQVANDLGANVDPLGGERGGTGGGKRQGSTIKRTAHLTLGRRSNLCGEHVRPAVFRGATFHVFFLCLRK